MKFVVAPAPAVLGSFSLSAMLQLACCVHLIVCVYFVASVHSNRSVNISGVEVSPMMQCITGAWFLLGVPVVIHGAIGTVFRVEGLLSTYLLYLLATLAVVVSWIVIFLTYGNSCETVQPGEAKFRSGTAKEAPSLVCGVANGMVVFWLLALVGAVVSAIYLTWSMKAYIRDRSETEFLRAQEPWQMAAQLADEAAQEQAMQAKQLHAKLMASRPPDATWAAQGANAGAYR